METIDSKKVSIIVPLYNAEKYMRKSILSITTQSYANLEIILVNDGSKDNTLSIAKEIATTDKRIEVLTQANLGPGAARNKGIDNCHGDYVCFVDSDDILVSTAVEELIKAAEEKYDLVQCRSRKIYSNGRDDFEKWDETEKIFNAHEALRDYLYNPKPSVRFSVWAKLFRREVIGDIRFPDINNSEDVVFNALIIDRCKKIKYIPSVLYNVTVREGSLSRGNLTIKKIDSSLKCNERILELTKNKYNDLVPRVLWVSAITMIRNACHVQEMDIENKKQIILSLRDKCKQLRITKEKVSYRQWLMIELFCKMPMLFTQLLKNILNERIT